MTYEEWCPSEGCGTSMERKKDALGAFWHCPKCGADWDEDWDEDA